ncbi:mitogen-activated protein kinase-binding protein 1 isoform X11 [Cotesia glomerata]|uniref:mitogen-activated protein kinase-binding protein 1 isoform X11 n=1 Tax=Cotesia glomerata TaxID=32391 RepID=UPI001D0056F1|nr:mitogen-activated protein kinase-binding protein 1 isoform X11 [Cotesia glomerata]
MDPPLTSKVLRAPSLKRGQENLRIQNRIKLERVLGVTVSSNAALDCDSTSELVAYPAGCTVVLFNPRKNIQAHVLNSCKKTVTSLALAGDGRLLVTGECGHMPNVRVWDISDRQNAIQIAEFSSHKYGINCVAFSPSNKYVVSIGSQHDMIVNVWDWRNNVKVASNKVSSKVKAVSFAENGSYFVTVGNRHVKFWYLEYTRNAKYKEPVPLMGRSAILGEQRNNDFVDVTCGRGEMADSTYAITKTGLLCEFNNRRLLDKWVELRTTSANCMAIGEKLIFVGCAEGIIRCFSPVTLQFITTLPRTHYLGVDVACGLSISHMSQHPVNARYPDAIALAFDELNNKLTCVYNDHSIYIWDIRDIKRVGKSHSFLFHSACIWGVEMYPTNSELISNMPSDSFVTCSSDDTIRVWNLKNDFSTNQKVYSRNIYSNELLKVLYIDPELTYLKDLDLATAGSTDKSDTSYDGRNGVRSIRISPDGAHIASGDRSGNIRIHDVATLDELCLIEAHDAEVLCLEYSKYSRITDGPKLLASASRDRLIHVFNVDEGYNFLQTLDDHSSSITAVRFFTTTQNDNIQMVSCGADKSIIFRQLQMTPGNPPQFVRDHNAQGKTTLYDMEVDSGQKHVLTACQDRNIRVYNVATGKHSKTFKGSIGEDGSLIKVVLDASGIYVATSCTDKTLCVYDYYSGECMATMLGHSELVTGLRFSPDCHHLVSASGDGCIFVWSIPHDMVVTMQARLTQQAMRAGKKPQNLQNGLVTQLENESFGPPSPEFFGSNVNSTIQTTAIDYRFSVGQLPHWAKKQINTDTNTEENITSSVRSVSVDMPKGRWAQRVQQTDGITVKSVYDSDEIIHFPPSRSTIDSECGGGGTGGSKDSSIDSGTETKCSSDYRREPITIKKEEEEKEEENVFAPCPDSYRELAEDFKKQMTSGNITITRGSNITELTHQSRIRSYTDDSSLSSFKLEDHESTEHDGDVEDYSEGENGTASSEKSHNLMYYPPTEDTISNQFKVNAIDIEELRRSMRRGKKIKIGDSNISELTTASGSQDDSDSEGGASTPSAERNPLSILSEASSEGYDQVFNQTHREKYLKNAFESLSGADELTNRKNTSISSQFHGRISGGENQESKTHQTPVINLITPKNTKLSTDVTKNREELQRRIEETRRKLQSVGYKSSLKSSQSISDLSSHIPDRHHRQSKISSVKTDGRLSSNISDSKDDIEDKGMRRACSLSDLSVSPPNRLLHGPIQVSGKLSIKNSNVSSRNGNSVNINSGLSSRYNSSKSHSTYMTRSSSVGVLNQHSDSESDAGVISSSRNLTNSTTNNRISGLMRPTISSQNKVNHQSKPNFSSSSNLPMVLRRRGMQSAYSSVNLSQVSNQEDSSSEDTSSNGNGGKPSLPPRPRSINIDLSTNFNSSGSLIKRSGSNTSISKSRLMNDASGQSNIRLSSRNQLDLNLQKLPTKDINVANAEFNTDRKLVSPQLCNTIADELTRTADNVVQLYKRLTMDSSANPELEPIDRDTMLRGLESSVNEAMRTLRLVAASTTNKESTGNNSLVVNEAAETFQELLAGQDQGKVVNIMQQYSELLLTMMQQRMSGTQPNHV